MNRLPATCAAIRAARTAALDIALEADMDGRPGVARALRRKAHEPRPGDWQVTHTSRAVVVTITAHGVAAIGRRHTTAAAPRGDEGASTARAAVKIVSRETAAAR